MKAYVVILSGFYNVGSRILGVYRSKEQASSRILAEVSMELGWDESADKWTNMANEQYLEIEEHDLL